MTKQLYFQIHKPSKLSTENLGKSKSATSYVFSVSLYPGCYRHIRISAHDTLLHLHKAIQLAFNFDDDHCHAFFMDNRAWSSQGGYYSSSLEEKNRCTRDHPLDSFHLQPRQPFKYVFDYGDCWTFQLKLLKTLDEPTEYPLIVRSVGAAPEQYGLDYDEEDDFDNDDDKD